MKVVSDRVSVLKKEDVLSIVILPDKDKKKLALMFLWLLAWTACGIIVLLNYVKLQNQNAKLFIIVYLSFWAYFEFKILRAFTWKRLGKEKLWIQNNLLHYQREINGKGKIRTYNLDLVGDLKMLDFNPASFSDYINQSFWIQGGEKLEFTSQAKTIRFGMQISEAEARSILRELKNFLSAIRQS